jgi:3-deoxy-D-manno-octulosonic acid kinase
MAESRMMQIDSGPGPDPGSDPGSDNRPDADRMLSVERIERLGKCAILYDGSLVDHAHSAWFDPQSWPDAPVAPGYSGGRGATLFISVGGQDWVLRHYHRGGHAARFASDGFIWLGEQRTRSFAEWRLLAEIHAAGLPAPRPVAARVVRSGPLYRADLITVRIPDVVPLSTRLGQAPVDAEVWRRVGECVGRFHAARFFHADLTAHNLQINGREEIFLLDFDRGRRMPAGGAWRRNNLERLQRSLTKISSDGVFSFEPRHWSALLEGYRTRVPAVT